MSPSSKKQGVLNWKCFALYVTRQLIWRQRSKLRKIAQTGYSTKNSSNWLIILCLLWDVRHELFHFNFQFFYVHYIPYNNIFIEHAKKVVSDSPGLDSWFCFWASEFCFLLARQTSDVCWGIWITEELWN